MFLFDSPLWIIIVLVVLLVAAGIAWSFYQAHLRRKMWQAIAARYGLRHREGDPFDLAENTDFALFQQGHSRQVNHTLDGTYRGLRVILFDFQYTTGHGKNKRTHYVSGLLVKLPLHGPYLQIRPETFFDRIAAAFGFEDINFEYERFNRAFRVTSDNKKFAYDICHPAMMEYLLGLAEHCWELRGDDLLLYAAGKGQFDPADVDRFLSAAHGFIERLPGYLQRA